MFNQSNSLKVSSVITVETPCLISGLQGKWRYIDFFCVDQYMKGCSLMALFMDQDPGNLAGNNNMLAFWEIFFQICYTFLVMLIIYKQKHIWNDSKRKLKKFY